jgi:hypothetical protein
MYAHRSRNAWRSRRSARDDIRHYTIERVSKVHIGQLWYSSRAERRDLHVLCLTSVCVPARSARTTRRVNGGQMRQSSRAERRDLHVLRLTSVVVPARSARTTVREYYPYMHDGSRPARSPRPPCIAEQYPHRAQSSNRIHRFFCHLIPRMKRII